jgi:hypothetical protein
MSGGDGKVSTLEYTLTDMPGFLLLHPFMPGTKTTTSQGPEQAMLIRCEEPPSAFDQGPQSLPWVIEKGGRGRQVVKSLLPTQITRWRSDGVDRARD